MNLLSISSNWTTNSDLEKCSTIYKDSDFQDFNEEDLDASNCVQLTRPNSCLDSPQVSVSLKESDRYISRLILISQSKRIEVSEGTFENPGSYIQTLTGKLSEDSDDDFKVYTIQNQLEKSKTSQLNLKLTGIQDSCWILNLVVITMPTEKIASDRFNLTSLNPDLALSDNAKDFKKLFETFQKTNSPSSHSMMDMMMLQPPNPEMLQMSQNPPNSEMMMQMLKLKSSADSEMLKSIMPNAPNMQNAPNIMPNAPNNSGDQSSCDKCFNRLESLEKLVIARLDQQDAKLDEILKLLQK